jgi:hypothetical protein
MIKNEIIKTFIDKINNDISEIEKYYKELSHKTQIIDLFISEILHDLELKPLNAMQIAQKSKELRGAMKLRRHYKDNKQLMDSVCSKINSNIVSDTIKNIERIEKNMDNRTFAERLEQEIRNEIIAEMEKI